MIYETADMKLLREKNERNERIRKRIESGLLKKVSATMVAYNVYDTSDEKPDISGINDWDEYWKHYTEENFADQHCASCGCLLDATNRVGAHIRLSGEGDYTQDAWIALFCKSCNSSRGEQKVRKDSWIVKTKMANPHHNVPTLEDQINWIIRSFMRR